MSAMTDTELNEELDRLHAMYEDGGSPTVEAYLQNYGELLPQGVAARVCRQHGTDLAELDTEVWWKDGSVYTVSLFSVLGY